MAETKAVPLVRLLAHSVLNGCAAGIVAGVMVAHWQPLLAAILSAPPGGLSRFAFLFICAQVGAVVALAISMLPEPSKATLHR